MLGMQIVPELGGAGRHPVAPPGTRASSESPTDGGSLGESRPKRWRPGGVHIALAVRQDRRRLLEESGGECSQSAEGEMAFQKWIWGVGRPSTRVLEIQLETHSTNQPTNHHEYEIIKTNCTLCAVATLPIPV